MPILVVLADADPQAATLRLGARCAAARRTTLSVIKLAHRIAPGVLYDGPLTEAPRDQGALGPVGELVQAWKDIAAIAAPCPDEPPDPAWRRPPRFRVVATSKATEAVLEVVREVGADLVLCARPSGAAQGSALADRLLAEVPCDMLALAIGPDGARRLERSLCPASGGPHARVALKLAEGLALSAGGRVTALYVAPSSLDEEAEAVAQKRLRRMLVDADVKATHLVEPTVRIARDVTGAIRQTVHDLEPDLLLLGATEVSRLRRTLEGSIPDALLRRSDGAAAVGVLRSAIPLAVRMRGVVEGWLRARLPQLDRERRLELVDRFDTASRFDVDFAALSMLATAIAAFGLIQNSAAVVIGAMLVAPLMTPMLGAGLAIAQGNAALARTAFRSVGLGFLVALAIGVAVGVVTPLENGLTPELRARGAPTLLDLAVALCSGVAAAYASARPNLSAALPGVAIAAALVPPIATVGISLANRELMNAFGATLLFTTNLVAIVLGAAGCLHAVGVRPNPGGESVRLWTRRALVTLVAAVLVLALGLGARLDRPSPAERTAPVAARPAAIAVEDDDAARAAAALREALIERLAEHLRGRGAELVSVDVRPARERSVDEAEREHGQGEAASSASAATVVVVIAAATPASPALAADLAAIAAEVLGGRARVQIETHVRVAAEAGG